MTTTTEITNSIPAYATAAALVEANYPGQFPRQMPIELILDWEAREIRVETRNSDIQGTTYYRWHGRESAFSLPSSVDASALREWVQGEIIPMAQSLFDAYSCEWDGSNHVGRFLDEDGDEKDTFDEMAAISQALEDDAPTTENGGLYDPGDWFGPAHGQIKAELSALDSEEAVEAYAAEQISVAESECVVFDGDAEEYLMDLWREARAEADEED